MPDRLLKIKLARPLRTIVPASNWKCRDCHRGYPAVTAVLPSTGNPRRCPDCHRKERALSNERHRESRAAYLRNHSAKQNAFIRWLKELPCQDCGKTYHFAAMEFDHRPGVDKKFCVARTTRCQEKFFEELLKCDIVCSNCHKIRTWERKTNKILPGEEVFDYVKYANRHHPKIRGRRR